MVFQKFLVGMLFLLGPGQYIFGMDALISECAIDPLFSTSSSFYYSKSPKLVTSISSVGKKRVSFDDKIQICIDYSGHEEGLHIRHIVEEWTVVVIIAKEVSKETLTQAEQEAAIRFCLEG